jgi:hypothetical protein
MLSTEGYTLSVHAKMRRKQMGVTEHRIDAVLQDPDTIYPGCTVRGQTRTCHQRDDLVVITDDRSNEVVTILWHGRTGR